MKSKAVVRVLTTKRKRKDGSYLMFYTSYVRNVDWDAPLPEPQNFPDKLYEESDLRFMEGMKYHIFHGQAKINNLTSNVIGFGFGENWPIYALSLGELAEFDVYGILVKHWCDTFILPERQKNRTSCLQFQYAGEEVIRKLGRDRFSEYFSQVFSDLGLSNELKTS